MLLKSFLNDKEHIELLQWAKSKPIALYEFGTNAYVYEFNNDDFELHFIQKLLNKIYKVNNTRLQLYKKECYVFCLKQNGFFPIHTDSAIRTNILLQKPIDSGFIIDKTKKVIMQEKDAYILDATQPHGVTTIHGNIEYLSLIFSLI